MRPAYTEHPVGVEQRFSAQWPGCQLGRWNGARAASPARTTGPVLGAPKWECGPNKVLPASRRQWSAVSDAGKADPQPGRLRRGFCRRDAGGASGQCPRSAGLRPGRQGGALGNAPDRRSALRAAGRVGGSVQIRPDAGSTLVRSCNCAARLPKFHGTNPHSPPRQRQPRTAASASSPMPDEFQYDVFLSHSAKEKAVERVSFLPAPRRR
jgi:hypothetical protein